MSKQALADNADIEAFSPINTALRPITLNATFHNNQKITLKKLTM
jgi:hypothetical protein